MKYALYLQISNAKSGGVTSHGVEAQRRDLDLYLKSNGGEVVGEFIDVMSGRKDDRPELRNHWNYVAAQGVCYWRQRLIGSSRDVEFWARLCKDKRLKIKVAQLPNADTFQIHLFAALAQRKAAFISARQSSLTSYKSKRGSARQPKTVRYKQKAIQECWSLCREVFSNNQPTP